MIVVVVVVVVVVRGKDGGEGGGEDSALPGKEGKRGTKKKFSIWFISNIGIEITFT